MSPPIVQTRIKPGKSIIIAYTVQNSGDPTNLQFLIRPFTPIGQLGSLTVSQQLEGPVQFNLENADAVLEKPFFFPSKEKRQAVLRIHIPPGVPDGDYYYMVMAETVPAFGVAGQSTGVASASIGSPLLISITESGVTEAKATIGEFSFIPDYTFTVGKNVVRIVDNAKELAIVCSVRNMGKNLIQPQGTITDQFGDTKNKYNIIPQNILSNSQRIIKTFSDENLDKAGSTLILSPISAGNHRVTAEMTFGENASVQYKTLEFLALPLRLIYISFFSLLIVLGLFVVRYIKRNTKH
ncbi:MAG: hypothetical protein NTZ55_04215 [Candidatus Roizmanbacteria bacterium]|nr:hypothetical protein [Candidatus Roizmanbacteria bacterium]